MLAAKALLALLLLLSTVTGQEVDDDKESAKRLQQLYKVLHNVALPAPLHGGKSSKRLVMMIPGQVLSEADYHPGAEFIGKKAETNPDKYLEYPPEKMQNLFNLVDVVPGIDPLQGQASQESFSRTYKDILGRMDIKGIDTEANDIKVRQKRSIDYLLETPEQSRDKCDNLPDDDCIKTRWDIYRYYEKIYNEKKIVMEERIDFERNNRTSLEYQYWFIRTFPSLQAEVDGAFMDWLVKGKKDEVELYRASLDTSSVGTLLLEAKNSLRASGFQSLDRTKTVYPINMIPGNWYRDLRDPDLKLTPDQRNMQIAYLRARLAILNAMKESSCDLLVKELEKRTLTRNTDKEAVSTTTTTAMDDRCKCAGGDKDACTKYLTEVGALAAKADTSAYSDMAVEGLAELAGNEEAINAEIITVEESISTIQDEGGSGFELPGLASIALGPQPAPPNNWLQFGYNSSSEETKETREKTSTSFSLSFKASYGLFSIGGSASHSKQTEDNFSSFKSQNVLISGELLRVTVQMPWFRPELFREEKLTMSDDIQVSPGTLGNDKEFTEAVKDSEVSNGNSYRLPQYVTGILLCRNLNLEFGGVSQKSSYSFVATSLSTSLSVGYGPFSLSASYSRSSQKSSFQASATATGLRIGVPGVQMIGYYTEIPPKFPK